MVHRTGGDALQERRAVHPRRDEPASERRARPLDVRTRVRSESGVTARIRLSLRRRLDPLEDVVAGLPQRVLDPTYQRVRIQSERRVSHRGERQLRRRRPLLPVQAQQRLIDGLTPGAARPVTAITLRHHSPEEASAGAVREPVRRGLGFSVAFLLAAHERVPPPPRHLLLRPAVRPLEHGHHHRARWASIVPHSCVHTAEQRPVGHGLHVQAAVSVGETRAAVQERLRRRRRRRGGGGRLMGRERSAHLRRGAETDG